MRKKFLIIFIIILVVLIISISSFNLIKYLRVKYAKIEIELVDNLEIEFNEEKKVSDFIKNINGTIINDYKIKYNELGDKTINFNFINDDGIKLKYSFNIKVVDTVKPVIWLGDTYSIAKGSEDNILESILCGDNYDNNPTCTIEGDYDLNVAGNYPLIFRATDKSKNENIQKFTLNVYEPSNKKSNYSKTNYKDFSEYVKKYKNENTKIGLDLSAWQDDVDFEKLKEEGVEFVIIRVGGTLSSSLEYFLDSRFKQNIENANKYGIKAGVYFYSNARNKKEALKDAKFVIDNIKGYDIDLPIAFDWEEWGKFNSYNISFYELSNIANTYLDYISKKGYKVMLYSSKNYLEKIWFKPKYDVWLAHYVDETNYEGMYNFWQVSNECKISGINGPVDVNVWYVNK